MKQDWENYSIKRGYLDEVKSKMSSKNKKIIDNFIDYVKINSKSKSRLKGVENKLIQIYIVLEKSLNNITLNDVESLMRILNHTEKIGEISKNEIKGTLKRFLKRQYSNWFTRFNNFECIKKTKHETAKQKLLKLKDIEALIRKAESLKWKALLILAFETGGRPSEILSLKWRDVSFENKSVTLHSLKNIGRKNILTREIRIEKAVLHLERYKQEYPYNDVIENDWVFPHKWNREKKMPVSTYDYWLSHLSEKTLGRKITPYTIRHTTLNILKSDKTLTDVDYEYLADHSILVANQFYLQTNKKRRDNSQIEIFKSLYNIKDLSEEEQTRISELQSQIKKQEELINKILVHVPIGG